VFIGRNAGREHRFCSANCTNKWRRANHLDDEERKCVICGNKFIVNKYYKKETCGMECKRELIKIHIKD